MLRHERGLDAGGDREAVRRRALRARAALTDDEHARLRAASLEGAPPHVLGDYPEWLDDKLAATFGDDRAAEGAALPSRAPLDLRVNTLKGERDEAARRARRSRAAADALVAVGPAHRRRADSKSPAIHAEPAFLKGRIEIQDEGSQLAALLAGAKPGEQVIDLCAGAGGKTLALAAMMENHGQLYATDTDKRRLAPIHERLERVRRAQRAGAHAARRRRDPRPI